MHIVSVAIVIFLITIVAIVSFSIGKSKVEDTLTQDWNAGSWGAYRDWRRYNSSSKQSVAEYFLVREQTTLDELKQVAQLHKDVYEALKDIVSQNRTLALTSPNKQTRDIAKQMLNGQLVHPSQDASLFIRNYKSPPFSFRDHYYPRTTKK